MSSLYSAKATDQLIWSLVPELAKALNGRSDATESEVKAALRNILLARRAAKGQQQTLRSGSTESGPLYRDSFVLVFNNGATFISVSTPKLTLEETSTAFPTRPRLTVTHYQQEQGTGRAGSKPLLEIRDEPLKQLEDGTDPQMEFRTLVDKLAPYLDIPEGDNNIIGCGGNEHEYYPAGSCSCPSNPHNQPNLTYNKNAFVADGRGALSIQVCKETQAIVNDLLNLCNEVRISLQAGNMNRYQYSPI